VAHAAIARAGMYLPPGTEPACCLIWAMPPESDPACWGGRWTSMVCRCHVSDSGNVPALAMAASTCRLCQWRHVPRVSWPDLPPPRGGLFWQFFLQVVFFDNSLTEVVFFVKNSQICRQKDSESYLWWGFLRELGWHRVWCHLCVKREFHDCVHTF
jgi:hypothetical protein